LTYLRVESGYLNNTFKTKVINNSVDTYPQLDIVGNQYTFLFVEHTVNKEICLPLHQMRKIISHHTDFKSSSGWYV